MRHVMPARRPQLAELGLFLLVVALPIVFTPFSASPFGDGKLVMLAGGTLALWASGLPADRRLAPWAAMWVAATAIAGAAGVEPARALLGRSDVQGGSLLLVGCSATLLVLGPALPDDLLERGRRWFVAATAVVGGLGLVATFAPGIVDATLGTTISLVGSSAGNQLFAAALLAAGLAAAVGAHEPERPTARRLTVVAFLAFAIGSFGERSAVVLPAVAVVVIVWRGRRSRQAAVRLAAAVIVGMVAWLLVSPLVPPDPEAEPPDPSQSAIGVQATDEDRLAVWAAMARSVPDRPLIGWGPGSSQSAYVSNATSVEIEEATRRWNDAHNLFLETLVSSGLIGLVPLVVLSLLVAIRAFGCRPARAWALGAAAALGLFAMVEPFTALLTPLTFLFAGAACAPATTRSGEATAGARLARATVAGGLALALALSVLAIGAATFERWGRIYGEQWALRRALTLQPWRTVSRQHLALQLALDGRAGDEAAGEEAISQIADAVRRAPWDVNVRLWAADVHTLLRDPGGAEAWVAEQIERFPVDGERPAPAEPAEGYQLPDELDENP
jgi:O-antigen ligase